MHMPFRQLAFPDAAQHIPQVRSHGMFQVQQAQFPDAGVPDSRVAPLPTFDTEECATLSALLGTSVSAALSESVPEAPATSCTEEGRSTSPSLILHKLDVVQETGPCRHAASMVSQI